MQIYAQSIRMYKTVFFYLNFSPSGKLVQIEYALAAVAAGGPSVGLKGLLCLSLLCLGL